jgi:hypothetical protein
VLRSCATFHPSRFARENQPAYVSSIRERYRSRRNRALEFRFIAHFPILREGKYRFVQIDVPTSRNASHCPRN